MLRWRCLCFGLLLVGVLHAAAQEPEDGEVQNVQAEEPVPEPPAEAPAPADAAAEEPEPPASTETAAVPQEPVPPEAPGAMPDAVSEQGAVTEPPPAPESDSGDEDLFDPEELIRGDSDDTDVGSPSGAAAAVQEQRRKEIADLEGRARNYFQALNYTRPARNNVLDVSKEILARDPDNAVVRELVGKMVAYYTQKGAEALTARDFARAIDMYNRLLTVDLFQKNRAFAEAQLAEARRRQSETPPADATPDVLLKRAEAAFLAKDYEKARTFYTAILQQMPGDPLARRGLEASNRALGVEPEGTVEERVAYYRQAGETFMERDDLQEAKFYYDKIAALDPQDRDARSKLSIIEDRLTPKGTLSVRFQGEPFWWSSRVDTRLTGDDAKAYIELVMKIDGETMYYRTDSDVEDPVNPGKQGHARNTYAFQDDYTFPDLPAGQRQLEVIVRGGTGEEAAQWTFAAPVQIVAGAVNELVIRTAADLKYNKKRSRMSGQFKMEAVR
jgi:tetratricopeptide (TPR) repeat protein